MVVRAELIKWQQINVGLWKIPIENAWNVNGSAFYNDGVGGVRAVWTLANCAGLKKKKKNQQTERGGRRRAENGAKEEKQRGKTAMRLVVGEVVCSWVERKINFSVSNEPDSNRSRTIFFQLLRRLLLHPLYVMQTRGACYLAAFKIAVSRDLIFEN